MKPGPKPTPRNLRLVQGIEDEITDPPANPVDEPPVKIPLPPEYLEGEEVDWFVHYARKLAQMRVMTEVDVELLVVLVRNWIDAQNAREKVSASGLMVVTRAGNPIQNPYLAIARKAEDTCTKIMAEFGMSPSARNRVSR